MKEELIHWYCFTFQHGNRQTTNYAGYEKNYVTLKAINDAKKNADVEKEAVLLACSYLGEMTYEQFKAE